LINIAANKLTAILGRAEAKDFVDLYFLLKRGLELDELVRLAKEKDRGFTPFYLAGSLRQARNLRVWPRMVEPLTREELVAFYEPLAARVMQGLKPWE
jgi:hypothetical protein